MSFIVNDQLAGTQSTPAVAVLANGGFAAVWNDLSGRDGSGTGLYLRVFDSSGTAIGGDILVPANGGGDQGITGEGQIARVGDGFVVVWTGGDGNHHARKFAADGTPASGDFIVNDSSVWSEQADKVSVTGLANGNMVFSWVSPDARDLGNVHARIFAADGTPAGAGFVIDQAVFPQAQPTPAGAFVAPAKFPEITGFSNGTFLGLRRHQLGLRHSTPIGLRPPVRGRWHAAR